MRQKDKTTTAVPGTAHLARITADSKTGLTAEQVRLRMEAGAHNALPQSLTPTVGQIIRKNTLTLFNFINLFLAVLLILVGAPENTLFLGIALCNTAMGIVQELRAKRTLDKLSIVAQSRVTALRDGKRHTVDQEEVVLDDILLVTAGNQICADGEVVESGGLEVDESLLTGESDRIRKQPGDRVLSGSFVTAGQASVRVTAVGGQSYANALTVEAKKEKKSRSRLMGTINLIIRVLTIVIVPVGGLLFYTQYSQSGDVRASVLGASAAMIGMIPEGLILLTGVTLTVGALNLAKRKALVQSLSSIETLARVDVLCLDKTGTITDGTLTLEEVVPVEGSADQAGKALALLMGALKDDNATATALRAAFPAGDARPPAATVPFSSARKWSGAHFDGEGCYVLGAPAFVLPGDAQPFSETAERYARQGFRVLCLAHGEKGFSGEALPAGLGCMALVILSDTVRREAPAAFRYFIGEGVALKVISGDDPVTVSTIADKAGIAGAERYVDMSAYAEEADFRGLVEENTVFGRVSPHQKRELIRALQANGHTTCMTGDGVNDVLAMKESDCSVAMIGGSDAARSACDFVLMTADFSAMVHVLKEGRRVINNIEKVSSLYLVKTIYSTLLSLLYIFLPFAYPFAPLQMTPINSLTVGLPSFILALRANYHRPTGKFLSNVLEKSLPAALTVVFNILVIQLAGHWFGLRFAETSTMNVFLTGAVGFVVLYWVARPLNGRMRAMLIALSTGFVLLFLLLGRYFMLDSLLTRNVFFYLPLALGSPRLFRGLNRVARRGEKVYQKWRDKRALRIR